MKNLEVILLDMASSTSDLGLRFKESMFLYDNKDIKKDELLYILDFSIEKLKKKIVKLYINLDEETRNSSFEIFHRYLNSLEKINSSFYSQIDSIGLSKNLLEKFGTGYLILSKAVKKEIEQNKFN